VIGEWPAYRVSNTHVMTMQHRLLDCYWQMRMPELQMGSDASVALIAFLTKQAEGGEIAVPGLEALRRIAMRLTIAILALSFAAVPALAQQKPIRRAPTAAVKAAFPAAPADWAARPDRRRNDAAMLGQPLTVPRRTSRARSRSASRRRSSIRPTTISWAIGRRASGLAQSGYGLRFTDYPHGSRMAAIAMPATSSPKRS
jgi:hypothetical protein